MLSKIAKNRYLFTAAFTILLTIILSYTIIFTKVTLGIKGEWVWQRVANVSIYYQNIILSIILFMISIFIAIKIDHKIKRKSYKIILILIISLISLYTDYRITSDSKIGNSESIHSIIDKLTIEYLAIDGDIKSHKNFFSSFLDFLNFSSTKKVNHKYIHSPGNILISHLSYRTILNYPRIKNILLLFTSKDKIMHAYHETKNQNYFPSSKDFEATYFTALLIYFIMLLALFAAKLLIITSILLLSKSFSNIGLIYILLIGIPAPILFLGYYDTLQYFISSLAMLFFIISIIKKFDLGSFLAGLTVGLGILFSISFGLITILISIVYFLNIFRNKYNLFKLQFFLFGVACIIFLCSFFSIDIISPFFKSLENNAKFYLETTQSYIWIIPDTINYIIVVGILPFILLIINAFRKRDKAETNLVTIARYVFICILLSVILNPYNRTETARLLIFLLPINLILISKDIVNTLRKKYSYYLTIISSFFVFILIFVIRLYLKLVLLF